MYEGYGRDRGYMECSIYISIHKSKFENMNMILVLQYCVSFKNQMEF